MKKLLTVFALGAGLMVGQAQGLDLAAANKALTAAVNLQAAADNLQKSLEKAKSTINMEIAKAKDSKLPKLNRGSAAVAAINASLVPLNNLMKLLKSMNNDLIMNLSKPTGDKFKPSLDQAQSFVDNITEMANTLNMLISLSGSSNESSVAAPETSTASELTFD